MWRIALVVLFAFAGGCAAQHGALRLVPAAFDDADVRAEVVGTATLTLRLHNKTDAPLEIRWSDVTIVGADHRLVPLASGAATVVAPGGRVDAPLVPFARPRRGARFELIVPTVVRGVAREYHFHLRAAAG
jgi:hypothetical protein